MEPSRRKEEFSRGWLRAVAAVAGLEVTDGPHVDDDSVDCTILATGPYGALRSPRIDVQLKCTAAHRNGDPIPFRLDRKNYDDLRGTDLATPRLLMVLFVPDHIAAWTDVTDDRALLMYCAYWQSLRYEEPLPPGRLSTTVRLPRGQRVTPNALEHLMELVGNGEPP